MAPADGASGSRPAAAGFRRERGRVVDVAASGCVALTRRVARKGFLETALKQGGTDDGS
jgi:hypothetical protein